MKWKYGDKRDMWCCPEPTVGLETVLQPNYFVQFWNERKNAKLPSLLTHLQKKLQMWASALSLSLDGLPLAPSYLKSCVQIGEINQLSAPGCICKRRSEKILAPESKKASSLQILSSDDMRDGGLGQNSLYWQKKERDLNLISNILPLNLL